MNRQESQYWRALLILTSNAVDIIECFQPPRYVWRCSDKGIQRTTNFSKRNPSNITDGDRSRIVSITDHSFQHNALFENFLRSLKQIVGEMNLDYSIAIRFGNGCFKATTHRDHIQHTFNRGA